MLDFLFKKTEVKKELPINEIYTKLKDFYNFESITDERKTYLSDLMEKYGYLPYPHIKALEELSVAETLFCLEIKWKNEEVFENNEFKTLPASTLIRHKQKNSDWLKKEGHDIKLINLASLGNGNNTEDTGKFPDWIKQLVTLPVGNLKRGIFPTTIYLIPFQTRDFGCAYLPKSSDVSPKLEDILLKENTGLNAEEQVRLFITMAQYAGHPVIYDILPQTGRFSKIVLANPHIARWFDINELTQKLDNSIETVAKKLEKKYDKEDVDIIKDIYKQDSFGDLGEDYKAIYKEFETEMLNFKKTSSNEMLKKEPQQKLQKRVREIVAKIQGEKPNKQFKEEEITKQTEIIKSLMEEGLWTAPGGAWCSCGVPIFDKMSDCGAYPEFKHYDYNKKDVSTCANLDCQTPFYFAFLENGQYNKTVIDFFIKYVTKFQNKYNFDGFRIDHVDHVVDEYSQKNGVPISYRIPAKVLKELNSSLKKEILYFGTLAEYMLGGNNLKEYQEDMNFDVLWGNDIPAQHEKNPQKILEDNQELSNYNTKNFNTTNVSILKTYNNQDGEFECFDNYPAKLGREGALFKWFKYKFLPGGKYAQRPIMYIDGDESFTKTGTEKTIGNEISLKREKDYDFFNKFDAINRLALSEEIVTEGEAQIIVQDEEGFVCWLISKEPLKKTMLIAANYLPPVEKCKDDNNNFYIKENEEINDRTINLPGDYKLQSEIIFDGKDFIERSIESTENSLHFENIKPSEFKIY